MNLTPEERTALIRAIRIISEAAVRDKESGSNQHPYMSDAIEEAEEILFNIGL